MLAALASLRHKTYLHRQTGSEDVVGLGRRERRHLARGSIGFCHADECSAGDLHDDGQRVGRDKDGDDGLARERQELRVARMALEEQAQAVVLGGREEDGRDDDHKVVEDEAGQDERIATAGGTEGVTDDLERAADAEENLKRRHAGAEGGARLGIQMLGLWPIVRGSRRNFAAPTGGMDGVASVQQQRHAEEGHRKDAERQPGRVAVNVDRRLAVGRIGVGIARQRRHGCRLHVAEQMVGASTVRRPTTPLLEPPRTLSRLGARSARLRRQHAAVNLDGLHFALVKTRGFGHGWLSKWPRNAANSTCSSRLDGQPRTTRVGRRENNGPARGGDANLSSTARIEYAPRDRPRQDPL